VPPLCQRWADVTPPVWAALDAPPRSPVRESVLAPVCFKTGPWRSWLGRAIFSGSFQGLQRSVSRPRVHARPRRRAECLQGESMVKSRSERPGSRTVTLHILGRAGIPGHTHRGGRRPGQACEAERGFVAYPGRLRGGKKALATHFPQARFQHRNVRPYESGRVARNGLCFCAGKRRMTL
jgi:hypothetical protein